MALTSLPILLYVIPAVMLLAALTRPRRKAAVLGLGGLAYEYFSCGWIGLSLLILSVCGAWLTMRMMHSASKKARLRHGAACGILWQCAVLITARFAAQLSAADMLPLLGCAMLGTESVLLRARGKLHVPPLVAYLGGSCAMPHLWAGPVLEFPALRTITEQRSFSAERLGEGASRCIKGLFQIVLLSVPLQTLLSEIGSYAGTFSLFDAWLLLLIRYCMVYHWLRGALRLGEGLSLMLGYQLPETMQYTPGAASLREFWERFCGSGAAWAKRILPIRDAPSAYDFLSLSLLFSAFSILLGCGHCGIVFGCCMGLLLTLGRLPALRKWLDEFPRFLRQTGTALLVLLFCGTVFSRNTAELFTLLKALFGANGTPLSNTVLYLCGTHILPLLLSILLLFPVFPALREKAAQKPAARRVAAVAQPIIQLGVLLCCMAELLSQYLRG